MTPTQEAALREATTCKTCANAVDWPTQLSKQGLCIECLDKRCEGLVDACNRSWQHMNRVYGPTNSLVNMLHGVLCEAEGLSAIEAVEKAK